MTDTTSGGAANTSRILVAVSDDSDPNGTWRYSAINSKLNISGFDSWADFPGLGIDSNAVYVTANMFTFGTTPTFTGSRLWIINKTPFYTNPGPNAATFTLHNPSSLGGLPTQAASLQPAEMIGAAPANMGTFLVSSSFSSGVNELVAIVRITNPITTPTFVGSLVNVGDINDETASPFPDAPQMGSATLIDTGSQRIGDAVWRNNSLYAVTTVDPKNGVNVGQATAPWMRFVANGVNTPTLGEKGEIGGEDLGAATATFFPSISVDDTGNVAIGFSASNASMFAGAFYTVHGVGDAAGVVQPTVTLAAGQGAYVRTFGDPQSLGRLQRDCHRPRRRFVLGFQRVRRHARQPDEFASRGRALGDALGKFHSDRRDAAGPGHPGPAHRGRSGLLQR